MNNYISLIILLSTLLLYSEPQYIDLKILTPNLKPVKNKKVTILTSNKTITTTTDNYGMVRISPPYFGKFSVEIPYENYIFASNSIIISSYGTYDLVLEKVLYSEISGTVYDKTTNTPLIGCTVLLFKQDTETSMCIPIEKILTDSMGRYSFKHIPCGYYCIKTIF